MNIGRLPLLFFYIGAMLNPSISSKCLSIVRSSAPSAKVWAATQTPFDGLKGFLDASVKFLRFPFFPRADKRIEFTPNTGSYGGPIREPGALF